MHSRVRLPALKAYLFFLSLSLFATAGCDVDVDFRSDDSNGNVESSETITGTVSDAGESEISGLFVKVTNEDDRQQTYSDSTESGGAFSITGNLDPGVKLEIFENENADSPLGSTSLTVFPGSELDIGDIELGDGAVKLAEDTRITFSGRISDKNCTDNNAGTVEVKISSEDQETIVVVQIDTLTDIDIGSIDDPECDSITVGDEVKIRGILRQGRTVEAKDIEID